MNNDLPRHAPGSQGILKSLAGKSVHSYVPQDFVENLYNLTILRQALVRQ